MIDMYGMKKRELPCDEFLLLKMMMDEGCILL